MFDYEWKAGLVFGLDTDNIYLVEEGEDFDDDKAPSTIITVYLGIVALSFIIR